MAVWPVPCRALAHVNPQCAWPSARFRDRALLGGHWDRLARMATFAIGDRVADHRKPTDCGTIVSFSEGPAGVVLYTIDWDNHPGVGVTAEERLVPCSTPSRGMPTPAAGGTRA